MSNEPTLSDLGLDLAGVVKYMKARLAAQSAGPDEGVFHAGYPDLDRLLEVDEERAKKATRPRMIKVTGESAAELMAEMDAALEFPTKGASS